LVCQQIVTIKMKTQLLGKKRDVSKGKTKINVTSHV
jgi:hypothetical protein